ncbi:hypothetical protein [Ekhidna sp.]
MQRRIRTLLQSIDTARYKDDTKADKEIDISHARSEALTALLFGYEIVIPAGQIADCPALFKLIPEVHRYSKKYRDEILKITHNNYNIFRIGLESQYRSFNGFRGYSAFVAEYLQSNRGDNVDFVGLSDVVKKDVASKKGFSVERVFGQAYLSRQWSELEKLGKDLSSMTGKSDIEENFANYSKYSQLVYGLFDANQAECPPIYTRYKYFTKPAQNLYFDSLNSYLKKVLPDDRQHRIKQTFIDARNEILSQKLSSGQRNSWYNQKQIFEDYNAWMPVRIWLDNTLYQRMTKAYGVNVPSYFTQEVVKDHELSDYPLAITSKMSVQEFNKDVSDGKFAVPPVVGKVDWESFWALAAEPEFQNSIIRLHAKYFNALEREANLLTSLYQNKNTKKLEDLEKTDEYRKIIHERKESVMSAINEHLEYINSQKSQIKFLNSDGKVMVAVKKPKFNKKFGALTFNEIVGVSATIGLAKMQDPVNEEMLFTVGSYAAGRIITEATKNWIVPSIIDFVSRPRVLDKVLTEQLLVSELNRGNYWITP